MGESSLCSRPGLSPPIPNTLPCSFIQPPPSLIHTWGTIKGGLPQPQGPSTALRFLGVPLWVEPERTPARNGLQALGSLQVCLGPGADSWHTHQHQGTSFLCIPGPYNGEWGGIPRYSLDPGLVSHMNPFILQICAEGPEWDKHG